MRSRAPNQRRRSPPTRNADSRRRPGDSGNHPKQKNEVRSSGTDRIRSVRENKEKAEVLTSAFLLYENKYNIQLCPLNFNTLNLFTIFVIIKLLYICYEQYP
nr:MAG TPA: hypothetical protein [Caudoviricetes sp.]